MGVITMSLLQEATLNRLWTTYQTRFGHPPPIESAGFEEAISVLREELAEQTPKPFKVALAPFNYDA
jgi:hypothetical protein